MASDNIISESCCNASRVYIYVRNVILEAAKVKYLNKNNT